MIHKPEVFIIESLNLDDEREKRHEGQFLSQILALGGKNPLYYYIRTKFELRKLLKQFDESHYRYLHLSCHGSNSSIETTFTSILFSEFGRILRPYLSEKRLFVSACSAVNQKLAREMFRTPGCISLIGPGKDVQFNDAAIIWASFYHLMFKINEERMAKDDIRPTLTELQHLFEVPLNYYSRSNDVDGFRRVQLNSNV